MGPKLKIKFTKETVSREQKLEMKREEQRRKRARLIKREKEKSALMQRASESPVSLSRQIKEEPNSFEEGPESELLPGPKGQLLYYDGLGYYYTQIYEDVKCRWLQCYHGDCKVMAQMGQQDNAPIHLVEETAKHDHPPNPVRRDRLLFLHTVKTRHANENVPFGVIFQEEAQKNPVGASYFSIDKIEAHLQKKISLGGSENMSQESALSAASQLSKMKIDQPTPDKGPVAKKMKIGSKPIPTPEKYSKKLERLQSLKDVSVTQSETIETPIKGSRRMKGPYAHSYLYCDSDGMVYKPLSISGNTRYLTCNTRGCRAKAVMTLEENAPIVLGKGSPLHNHSPAHKNPLPVAQTRKEVAKTPVIRPITIATVGSASLGYSCSYDLLDESALVDDQATEEKMTERGPGNRDTKRMQSASVVLNKFPHHTKVQGSKTQTVEPLKRFEKLEGPEYFYDLKGYYYFSTKKENNRRFLRCLTPTCPSRAMLISDDDTEIRPINGSRPHNHQPDFFPNYHDKIKQWDDHLLSDNLPSERLPSLRVQYCCYHDGRGYYFYQTSQSDNIRYLACSDPKCPVKACMNTLKDAPISVSGLRMGHNHRPDYTLRDALLFVDGVRVRVRSGTSIPAAISLEAGRNQVGAERVNLQMLRNCLDQAAKISNSKGEDGAVEDEVDFASCLVVHHNAEKMKPSTESQLPVQNHFNSSPSSEGHLKKEKEGNHTNAEMVPALFSDSWLYHDGCGYFYNTKSIYKGFRYLQCVQPKCGVHAVAAEGGGPVKTNKPHSHGPQSPQHRDELWFFHRIKVRAQKNPDMPITQVYREVAERDPVGACLVSQTEIIQLMHKFLISVLKYRPGESAIKNRSSVNIPCAVEVIPIMSGDSVYHDGNGFYYNLTDNARKGSPNLKCSYQTACPARAVLTDGKVTMNKNTWHNHKPDLIHRDICLFSQALKRRARDEDTPLSVVYQEESKRYPEAATVLLEDRLKPKLLSIRKFVKNEINAQLEEEEDDGFPNCPDQSSKPDVASEKFIGKIKDVYYDGRGYYYHETFINNQIRYLICCEPHCLAQGKMGLADGAPVMLQVGAPRHCHAPDPLRRQCLLLVQNVRKRAVQRNLNTEILYQEETAKEPLVAAQVPMAYLYTVIQNARQPEKPIMNENTAQHTYEDDTLWTFSGPCEKFPSQSGWIYVNDQGYMYYCYSYKTHTSRHLRCCEEGCDATAQLDSYQSLTRAPGSVFHNHMPQPRRRSMLMLLHRVAIRAQSEHKNVTTIFIEEAERDPDSASLMPRNKLNELLQTLTVRRYFKSIEEEELDHKEHSPANEEELTKDEVSEEPCEILPSVSSDKEVYHDGNGHYFIGLRQASGIQYVKCLMPLCGARGYIHQTEPWKLHVPKTWAEHNHKSDLCYRNKLLYINSLKTRTLAELTSIDFIYEEESEREPVGADQVDETFIKNYLHKLRKSKTVEDDVELFPYEDMLEDLTKHSSVTEKASKPHPPVEIDKIWEPAQEKTPMAKVARPSLAQVTMKTTPTLKEEDDDEYTDEEFLEEEKLEEEEGDITMNNDECLSTTQSDKNLLPTETLYSRTQSMIYYNGQGYYYRCNGTTGNIMYLKCIDPRCRARGTKPVDKEDAPVIPNNRMHNHQPDYNRRDQLVFIFNCKIRAAREPHLEVRDILDEEMKKNPDMAMQMSSQSDIKRIKHQMRRYRIACAVSSENAAVVKRENQDSQDGIIFHDDSTYDTTMEDEPQDSKPHPPVKSQKICGPPQDKTPTAKVARPSLAHVTKKATPIIKEEDDDECTEESLEEENLEEEEGDITMNNDECLSTTQSDQKLLPTETLYSRTNSMIYYNGQGYYYHCNGTSGNIMYMKCIETRCRARGTKPFDKEDAPIIPNNKMHTHQPDYNRRDQLVFIFNCKIRAAREPHLEVRDILDEEMKKNPEMAKQMSSQSDIKRIKHQMRRYRVACEGISFNDDSISDTTMEAEPQVELHHGEVPEKVPSLVGDSLWYAEGYFYSPYSVTGDLEKVKCVEKECKVRAQVYLSDRGQPLSISVNAGAVHSHTADLQRKDQLVFIDRCKRRAATTLQSVEEIYFDEAAKAPEVAAQLSAVRVKRAMSVAKKEKLKKGIRLESKEGGESGDHGMSELGEMAKNGKILPTSTSTVEADNEEAEELEVEAQKHSDYNEESTDDLYAAESSFSSEEKKRGKVRERQRKRQMGKSGDLKKSTQLKKEGNKAVQRIGSKPKSSSKLGPKFVKQLVNAVSEEGLYEEEETLEEETLEEETLEEETLEEETLEEEILEEGTLEEDILKEGTLEEESPKEETVEEETLEEVVLDEAYDDYVTLEEDVYYNDWGQNNVEEEVNTEGGTSVNTSQKQDTHKIDEERTTNTKSSHLVHGGRANSYCYHDGKGFYYETYKVSKNNRYLKCTKIGCPAKALSLVQDNAPINLTSESPAHSHPPDPRYLQLGDFVHKCGTQALNKDTPLQDIYYDVAEEDPVSASKLVMDDLLRWMTKIRVEHPEDQTQDLNLSGIEDQPSIEENMESEMQEDEVDNLSIRKKKSEVLPGYRPNATVFHDMKGYYYIFNALKDNKRYVRCIEPLCRVRGSMLSYPGAPIRTSAHAVHNHRADLSRKYFLLFLKECKDRAMNEDLPLSQIYREECDKDPVSANKISSHNLLQRMQRARKLTQSYQPTDQDQSEFVEACFSNSVTKDIPPHELVEEKEENSQSQDSKSDATDRMSSQKANKSAENYTKQVSGGPVPEDHLVPSEALPGIRPNSTMYHDGRGYYYLYNNHSENIRYLRCVEPQCRVRAHMEPVEGSPIVQTTNMLHNHQPDFKRRKFALWMEQAKHRAVTEPDVPIPTIYAEEAARDPDSAGMILPENMKVRMYRARKATVITESPQSQATAGEDCKADEGGTAVEVTASVAGDVQLENNETGFETQNEEEQECNTVYVYQSNSVDQKPTYVDDNGFCYHQTTVRSSTRYLKCAVAGCKARASMGLAEDSSITLSKQGSHHNHSVEQSQLAMLVEPLESENDPMQVIYTYETEGEQVTLCQFTDDAEAVAPPKRSYKQRTTPQLTINPEEPPLDTSAVNEVDVAAGEYYHNEEQQKYPLKPSEVVPGLRPDANNYHDGNGFYYELNRLSPNIRYLKCLIKDCKARAYMELSKENAPIIQTNFASHNHGPDLRRKQFTVFLHRVTRRAAEEDTPINVIYQQEADRDPLSASQIRMENVKQRMLRFRKKHKQSQTPEQEESSAAETDVDGSIYHFLVGSEKLEQIHQCEGEEEGEKGEAEQENEEEREEMGEEMWKAGEGEREEVLYESYVVSEVEVESQQLLS